MRKLRIGLDLDDTINYWWNIYIDRFGNPKSQEEITYNVWNILRHDKDFWETLPVKNRLSGFEPELYCTSRVSKKTWAKKWLAKNGFPGSPVYQRFGFGLSKAPLVKGRVDVFIDDSPFNVFDLNSKGIPCLMINSDENKDVDFEFRIETLDYEEIAYQYGRLIINKTK